MDLFDLYAKISLDDSGYNKGIDGAVSKGQGLMSKIGSGIGTVAKISGAALAAGATAATALIKQSVDAYGSYEQLVGGVETLFGNAGQSLNEWAKSVDAVDASIMGSDAWNKYHSLVAAQEDVLNNANDAYKNAGMSANEYMETVTSFAASLIQSLDGDTVAAAAKADMAITDMSDNANKMGSDIESIQNAYKGFSKQNYTMLDNLKLGYGGTKEEMKRLLEDAQKFSGIKYDMSSYADVTDAIHVIQNEMGITGTTAKEASSTIQGSIGMLKASFENFLTGLGSSDPGVDVANLAKSMMESFSTVIGNLTPVVDNIIAALPTAINAIITAVTGMLPQVIESVTTMAGQLITAVVDIMPTLLPTLANAAFELFNGMMNTILENIDALSAMVTTIVTNFITFFLEAMPQIVEAGIQILVSLANGIAENLDTIIPACIEAVMSITNALLDNIDKIIDAGIKITLALVEGIIDALPDLIEKMPEIIEKIVKALIDNLPKILDAGFDLILKLIEGIIKAIPKVILAIGQLIKDAVEAFKKTDWAKVGKDVVDGIWTGLKNAWDSLKKWFSDAWDELVGGVKDLLGIHSPSTVFAEIGGNMAAGIGVGFDRKIVPAYKDMAQALSTQTSNFSADAITTTSSDIIINIGHVENYDTATDMNKLARVLSERIAAQTGRKAAVYA